MYISLLLWNLQLSRQKGMNIELLVFTMCKGKRLNINLRRIWAFLNRPTFLLICLHFAALERISHEYHQVKYQGNVNFFYMGEEYMHRLIF